MKDVIIRNDSGKRRNFPITVEVLDEQGNMLEEVHCEAVKLDADAMTLYMHRARWVQERAMRKSRSWSSATGTGGSSPPPALSPRRTATKSGMTESRWSTSRMKHVIHRTHPKFAIVKRSELPKRNLDLRAVAWVKSADGMQVAIPPEWIGDMKARIKQARKNKEK